MPRPHKPRRVQALPRVTYFKPAGIPVRRLEEVILTVDELEAIRLKDLEGLEQSQCAEKMGVGQSTLQRILATGRRKLARAIVEGKALRIQGGAICLSEEFCPRCHRPRGRRGGGDFCPECRKTD